MSPNNYRLYTFVAGLYLSELQKGLQTAHVVGELSQYKYNTNERNVFDDWALQDKTIIICNAGNHQGVRDCWSELVRINSALSLPAAIFYEDGQSMNGMATACGVIVPQCYYDVTFVPGGPCSEGEIGIHDARGYVRRYPLTHAEGQFINHIKKYRLA